MKAREWSLASEAIAGVLPGFRSIKFGYVRESQWWAECLYANTSAFNKDMFYLEAFVLPLFVPTTFLYFDYGFRVGAWESVTLGVVRAVERALPKLASLASFDGLMDIANNPVSVGQAELRMCIAILKDDLAEADREADHMRRLALDRPWEEEVRSRGLELNALLHREGRPAALERLRVIRSEVVDILA